MPASITHDRVHLSEFIAIGVGDWHNIKVHLGQQIFILSVVGDKLVDHVGDSGGSDPLTSVTTLKKE